MHVGNVDGNEYHDHTYYGNGEGDDGSIAGPTRIPVPNYDNESQKNGTIYNYQAATSGYGAAMTTDNISASDTFCPLGWQMPYSGTGGDYDKSKSWKYLYNLYGIINNQAGYEAILSYPFSEVLSGNYNWQGGNLANFNFNSLHNSSTNTNQNYHYKKGVWAGSFSLNTVSPKAIGNMIRCNIEISIQEQLSMASA